MENTDLKIIINNELTKIEEQQSMASGYVPRIREKVGFLHQFLLDGTIVKSQRRIIEVQAEIWIRGLKIQGENYLLKMESLLDAQFKNLTGNLADNVRDTLNSIMHTSTIKDSARIADFKKKMMDLTERVENDETFRKNPQDQALEVARIRKEMYETVKIMEKNNEIFRLEMSGKSNENE